MQDGRKIAVSAVDVLINEHLIIESVDRIVKRCAVESEINAWHVNERPIVGKRHADAAWDSARHAFLAVSEVDFRAVRIAESDPDLDAAFGLVADESNRVWVVLGEEQARVGNEVDLFLGTNDGVKPQTLGHLGAVRAEPATSREASITSVDWSAGHSQEAGTPSSFAARAAVLAWGVLPLLTHRWTVFGSTPSSSARSASL
jgi:hypothetical protein